MIIANRKIPELNIDRSEYKPFIHNDWFRKHYMWFAYGLMVLILVIAMILRRLSVGSLWMTALVYLAVYVTHEALHVLTVCQKGDVYLSRSGLYLWLTPDFPLSKWHFWFFISTPLLVLTGLTGVLSFFVPGEAARWLKFIAWTNAFTAGSDIINSVLVLVKPRKSVFYRGYYK